MNRWAMVRYDTYSDYPSVLDYGDDFIQLWGDANQLSSEADNFEYFVVVSVEELPKLTGRGV